MQADVAFGHVVSPFDKPGTCRAFFIQVVQGTHG